MARGDLTDEEWDVIAGLLPSERGRKSRPAHDNRRFLNGMLHVLRVGCPWRDMHERYGLWNSVYVWFRRWAEKEARAQAFGRSRGGFTCNVHARCDNQGSPFGFILTRGEASDYGAVDALMAIPVIKPKALLADKGYDGNAFRENLLIQGILPVIPPRPTAVSPFLAIFAAIGIATASSACLATSSNSAVSTRATTKLPCPCKLPQPRRDPQMAAPLCQRGLVRKISAQSALSGAVQHLPSTDR